MSLRSLSVLAFMATATLLSAQRTPRAKDAAPEVHFLSPGFDVGELPVKLPNAVNLQYRHDGRLVVLCYNGDIHLLRDADGDGAEETADLFWAGQGKVTAPIGMDLAPKGTPHGDAVFFACKGKVMMVTDRDGDGKAEEERVLAEGWPLAMAGIDTASVCYDARDGSVLFGLGVRLYNNAYELDERGVALNDLSSERGAILRIAPDFKSREKLCTGVRWPIGLRFNAEGDLFCTDQEGATWLPNGNPLDELLHIERGRHYGFPPRHPRHLPSVVDEPSVFDYGPQHQSTCGLRFNDGVNGGPSFGPASWRGDALITGQARGKIYRTKLVKSAHGYVAHNQIIACLNQLAVDLTVSPRGDLLIATHSGDPDWGTGPKGMGRIFRVRHADPALPQPVYVWSAKANELRVKFDRPLTLPASEATVRRGVHVRAGDRHETMWPGYEAIKLQHAAPIARLTAAMRTGHDLACLTLPPQTAVEHYAFEFAGYDLDTQPAGLELTAGNQRHVLPHPEAKVSQALFGPLPALGGAATLRTRLDLGEMLQPAIQPGAALDYERPAETVTLWFANAHSPFEVSHHFGEKVTTVKSSPGQVTHDVFLTVTPPAGTPLDLEIRFPGEALPHFTAAWSTRDDSRPRAFPLRRFLVPWAQPELHFSAALARPEIAGGDWQRGREVFFSDQALCGKCHAVRGHGGKLGPDLSNLTSRSYDAVLRDIRDPSAVLNPDHIAADVTLADGRKMLAVLRDEADGRVILGVGAGAEISISRAGIARTTPSKISLMPAKLDEALGPQKLRDLMAFLLTEPPVMGVYHPGARPPKRPRAEIDAVLAGSQPVEKPSQLRLVLVGGKKDHGVGEHDYPRWRQTWARLFTLAESVTVELAHEWPSAEQWRSAQAVVFNRRGDWDEAKEKEFDAFLARGGGITFIHWSLAGGEAETTRRLAARLGLASQNGMSKYRHGAIDLTFTEPDHPITRGFTKTQFMDEMYWNLAAGIPVAPLATAHEAGAEYPHAWTQQPAAGGRIFVTLGGHYSAVFDDPLFRLLLLRGIAWTAQQPVDRFNHLIEAGLEP